MGCITVIKGEKVKYGMKYIITIRQIEENVPYKSQQWKKLVDEPDANHTNIYGYVTEEGVEDVTTDLLEQTVYELNLPTVIKAINGLV